MRRRGYPISTKLQALGMLITMSDYKVSVALDVPRRTLRNWISHKHEILAYDGNLKNIKLEPGGRYEVFPDPPGPIEFINHVRDNECALMTTHLILWMKANQREWLNNCLATKQQSTSYDAFLRLLQRFCHRHGFSRQRPTKNKVKQADLAEVQSDFAAEFHREYIAYGNECVYNIDEADIYYDMPPRYIWAVRSGSSKILSGEKHSLRMTAVLTVLADGTKLPILFISSSWRGCLVVTLTVAGSAHSLPAITTRFSSALVKRSIAAWDLVSSQEIRRSFEKALPY
ncbi:hypothetical protein B5M09_009750 [Aphanomyces astaci]|uniref:DDE-1 domain-containing protein n=1 Tax=Aphanomyces astaci TaxID=112090 RepID=A0A425CWV3_APHAT|nr:hypothetical protein B5M09_009750 [Aphanomyces astaci]